LTWLMALLATVLLTPALSVLGQEATPGASPVASGEVIRSVPRAEVEQLIRDTFGIEEPQAQGGSVVVGEVGDITTLNPLLADDQTSFDVVGMMFETLAAPNVINGQIVPGLADSYEIAADGVTHTFKLNPDARWHDGEDITADDVVYSFDRRLDPVTGGSYQSGVVPFVASYRAIDDDTFEIVAKERLATFLYDVVAYVLILPQHIWESVPVDTQAWQTDPGSTGEDPSRVIGSGPFKFERREEGVQITLVRNDDYYLTPAVIDQLSYQMFEDSGTAVQSLKTGQIDILESIDFQEVEPLRATGQHTVDVYDSFSFNYMFFNQNPEASPLFIQREVRQAMMYGIDRDAVNESIFFGYGQRAVGSQPLLSFAYAPERIETDFVYDPARANQLLDQAGWIDTNGDGTRDKDGVEFSFEMTYFAGVASFDELAAYLQQAYGELGLELIPNPLTDDALTAALDNRDFEMVFYGFGWDAAGNQGLMFRCDAQTNGFNFAGYCNPEYDRIDDLQQRELNPDARRDLLIQLANIVNEDQAVGVIRFIETRTGYTDRIQNFHPTGYGLLWSMPYVYVTDGR